MDAFFKHYYHNQWLDHTHFDDERVVKVDVADNKVVGVFGNDYNRKGHLVYTGRYEKGKFNGHGKLYNEERCYYEGNFEDGKRSGQFEYHTERYVLFKGNYNDDKRQGKCTEFYSDGRRRSECEYANDKKNGRASEFDGNGGLLFKGAYKDDVRSGEGSEFLGPHICKHGTYSNGKLQNWKWCYMLTPTLPMDMNTADHTYPDNYYESQPIELFGNDCVRLFDCSKGSSNGSDPRGNVGNGGRDDDKANNYFLCGRVWGS